MGLYLGLSVVPGLLIAFFVGSLVGLGLVAATGDRKLGVPFGPFLAVGGVVGLLLGPQLIHLYSSHFLS